MGRLTYRSAVLLVMALVLVGSLGATWLAYYGAARAEYHLKRSQLAHNVLEGYLELSVSTQALFKRMADVTLTGEAIDVPAITRTQRAIEGSLRSLRQGIAAEIAYVEDDEERAEETAELDNLAAVEREIARMVLDSTQVVEALTDGRRAQARAQARGVLDRAAEQRLAQFIDEAVAKEAQEVAEVDLAASSLLGQIALVAKIGAVTLFAVVAASCYGLVRRLRRPMRALDVGMRRFAQGAFDHRIELAGADEFAQLGEQLNRMAAEIDGQRRQLRDARDHMEHQVAERTQELAEANRALQRADRQRRGFLADISHELRTPLTVLRGEAEVALRGADKSADDYKGALRRIVDQTQQTTRLVEDLLFVARAETGEARLQVRAVALRQLLERNCADAGVLARDKGVIVEADLGGEEFVVSADAGRLRQLFMILLDNAVRYSRPHGLVRVILGPSPGGANVRIVDEGVGIAPEDVERVFERFYRGGNASSIYTDGSGLGLPVARAIVEAHGGRITIDSALDHGTTVSVTLAANGGLRAIA